MNDSLVQQTADEIYRRIISAGAYRIGDRIPNEYTLSGQLGVSRATLREAIRILSSEGVLKAVRGRGTFIVSDTRPGDYDLRALRSADTRLKDLFEARLLFEPEIAALACRRASDAELEHILRLGEEVAAAIRGGEDRTQLDQEFHRALMAASHNEFLTHLLPVIQSAIAEAIQAHGADTLSESTITDHAMLMEFLRARDAEGARQAMAIHVRHAIHALRLGEAGESIL